MFQRAAYFCLRKSIPVSVCVCVLLAMAACTGGTARALLPAVKSPIASFFESNIKGQADVSSGKATTLAGVRALDSQTLQITLTQPTPYFLEEMTNSVYFPLNRRVIDRYGQTDWPNHVAGSAVGSGPFMVREWDHKVKMVLVPNPHYYGARTRLTEVDMSFVVDQTVARAEQATGVARIDLYNQAEQLAIQDVGWLPLDHQALAEVIPAFIHGLILNGNGLYFGDWSDVYVLAH